MKQIQVSSRKTNFLSRITGEPNTTLIFRDVENSAVLEIEAEQWSLESTLMCETTELDKSSFDQNLQDFFNKALDEKSDCRINVTGGRKGHTSLLVSFLDRKTSLDIKLRLHLASYFYTSSESEFNEIDTNLFKKTLQNILTDSSKATATS